LFQILLNNANCPLQAKKDFKTEKKLPEKIGHTFKTKFRTLAIQLMQLLRDLISYLSQIKNANQY